MAGWTPFLELWSVATPLLGDDPIADAKKLGGLYQSVFGTDKDGNVRIQVLCTGGWQVFEPEQEVTFPKPDSFNKPWTASVDEVAAFRFLNHPQLTSKPAGTPILEGIALAQRRTPVVPKMPRGPYIPDSQLPQHDVAAYARLCQSIDRLGSFARVELDERPGAKGLWWLQFRFPFRAPLLGGTDGLGDPGETGRLDPELLLQAASTGLTGLVKDDRFRDFSPSAPHQREAGAKRIPFIAGGLRKSGDNLLESFAVNAAAISTLHGHVATQQWNAIDLVDPVWWPKSKDRLPKMVALTDGLWWAKQKVAPNGNDTSSDVNLTLEQALEALKKSAKVSGGAANHPILSAPLASSPAIVAILPPVRPAIALLDFLGLELEPARAPVSSRALEPKAATPPYHYLHTCPADRGVSLEWRRWVPLKAPGAIVPMLMRVRQPLPVTECIKLGKAAHQVTLEGLDDCHALDLWTRLVGDPLRLAAEKRFGRGAIGLLPSLIGAAPGADAKAKGGYWTIELALETPLTDVAELMGSQVQPIFDQAAIKSMTLYRATRRPAGPTDNAIHWFDTPIAAPAAAAPAVAAAAVAFPNLLDHARRPLRLKSDRVDLSTGRLDFSRVGGEWLLSTRHDLVIHHHGAEQLQVVAIGGLDLNAVAGAAASELSVKIENNFDATSYRVGSDHKKLFVALARVDIGGSDEREPIEAQPLVWSAKPIIDQGALVAEDFPEGSRRRSNLSLQVSGNAGSQFSSVSIIDPGPMSVATVKARQLKAPTATQASVATWNTTESYWRITREESEPATADIILPPQGVAEAWERSGGAETNHLPADQIGEGDRVPARLPPTAMIRIETEERAKNPVAPWNLRRLLADIDVDLPGGRLLAIERLEALYGLEARAGDTHGLRIAETVAWRGTVRRALIERVRPGDRFDRWAAAGRLWDRRLAVLDVRAEAAPLSKPVIRGVSYRLRPEGRYVEPVRPKADGTSLITLPPGWKWTSSDKGGILGGALAGFEQPSLIEDLLGDARNGRGEIDGLMLSALGSWTGQRAEFNRGLSLIAVELHMGRVDEARFERKGRIGALHHLAKHVIVYRRSFLPSRQFRVEQNYHVGRPIVRKAEEYIEIMQPVRRYPDRSGVPAKRSGPLVGGQFRTIRIPVNGSWAKDLPDPRYKGYYIPLWQPDADSGIYPRPTVEMLLAGDLAATNNEPLGKRVENPDQLRFYTLTGQDISGDVESWPNVYGVDVEDRPIDDPIDHNPANKLKTEDFQSTADPARPLPPAMLVPLGLERFTLKLEQGPGANLGEGRFEKPILSDLRTVTIMRGARTGKPAPSPVTSALKESQRAKSLIGELGDIAKGAAGNLGEARDRAKVRLTEIAAKLPTKAKLDEFYSGNSTVKELTRFCSWVDDGKRRIDRLVDEVKAFAKGLPEQAEWEVARVALLAEIARAQSQAHELLSIDGLVKDIFKGPLDEANGLRKAVEKQASASIAEAKHWIGEAETTLAGLAANLPAPLQQMAAKVKAAPAPTEQLVAEARAILQAVGAKSRKIANIADQLEKASRSLGDLIDKNKTKLQKIAPGKAPALLRLAEGIRQRSAESAEDLRVLKANIDGWAGKASAALSQWSQTVADAQQALAGLLDEAADALTTTSGKWINAAERSRAALDAFLDGAEAELKRLLDELFVEADTYVTELDGLASSAFTTALDKVMAPLRALAVAALEQPYPKQAIEDVKTTVDGAIQAWQGLERDIRNKVDAVCTGMAKADAMLQELIERGRDKLLELIPELDAITQYEDLLGRVGDFASALDHAIGQISDGLGGLLDSAIVKQTVQPENLAEDIGLNLLRAAGAPPIVEQLVFNRDQLAYYFENKFDRVVTTPVTALLDQGEAVLRGMGVALPTLGIQDNLLAPMHDLFADAKGALDDIELKAKEVLKDFAGLKDMIPKLKFDSEFARAIKITHDYDAARRIAWLQGAITYGPKTAELFSYDAFAVIAEKMSLNALSRYERSLSGDERREVSAKLASDWVMQLGGTTLVRIRDAVANYDDRKGLSFDIKPQNIEFAGAIQLLTNALKSFSGGDNPLTIELIEEDGKPVGLKSRYDMPPTTFSFGAVTILNASLGVHLDLAQRSEFEIRIFAYFGRQSQPFSLIVGWLGGGGYLEAEAIHRPRSQSTEVAVALSVGACAGAGFAFGPLAGYVQVYLGLRATYRSGKGGARLNIAAIIVVSGSVTAWGFVTIGLGMTLAITYEGSNVVGRGHVDVSVRISRFYKKSFSRPIKYKLGG